MPAAHRNWIHLALILGLTACQERAILGTVPSLLRPIETSVATPVPMGNSATPAPSRAPLGEPLPRGLSGTVFGPKGSPLEDVLVRAHLVSNASAGLVSNGASSLVSNGAGLGFRIQAGAPVTRTDGKGSFTIPVSVLPDATASYNLEAVLDDGYKSLLSDLMVGTATVSLQLEHTGRITGQLRGQNALVNNLEGITVALPGTSYQGSTDRQGRFTLDHVPRGSFKLLAGKPGVGTLSVASISVRPDETTDVGTLTLQFVQPELKSIVPTLGTPGTVMVIEGRNLGITSGETLAVDFPGARATAVRPIDENRVQVTVPPNAGSGELSVTVNGLVSNGISVQIVDDLAFTAGPIRPVEDRFAVPGATRSMGLKARIDRQWGPVDFPVAWQVRPAVATLSADGFITATGTGSCTVTARFGPRLEATQTWWALSDRPSIETYQTFEDDDPVRLLVDPDATLWILTTASEKLLKLDPLKQKTVVAGSAGSPNTLLSAEMEALPGNFDRPQGLARLANGNIVVADTFHRAVRILETASTRLRTYAPISGTQPTPGNPAATIPAVISQVTPGISTMESPSGIDITPDGRIVVADSGRNGIYAIKSDGSETPFQRIAGGILSGMSSDGVDYNAAFSYPYDVLALDNEKVLVAERYGHLIRQVDLTTRITTTIAGSLNGYRDGETANARFSQPVGLARGPMNWRFVSEVGNNRIRLITPEGETLTLAGSGLPSKQNDASLVLSGFNAPHGLVWDAARHQLWIADNGNKSIRVIKLPGL